LEFRRVLFRSLFAFSSGIATATGLFFSSIGFITPNVVDVPFGLPIGVNAILGWGWQGVIVQLIILFVGVLIYVPFVLAENRVKEENYKNCLDRDVNMRKSYL